MNEKELLEEIIKLRERMAVLESERKIDFRYFPYPYLPCTPYTAPYRPFTTTWSATNSVGGRKEAYLYS